MQMYRQIILDAEIILLNRNLGVILRRESNRIKANENEHVDMY
jgi:hypothetical protein